MEAILIPELQVKEFTRMLGKHNGIEPVELENGEFFIEDEYLKNESMVSDCKTEIDKMRLEILGFEKKILTEIDFKEYEMQTIKL